MNYRVLQAIVSLFVVALLTAGSANAAPYSETNAAIDDFIRERMQALKIPGAALAIVRGDQIDYLQAYGVADRSGRAVTPQTPFMLASVSKSFTALAIMQLFQEGKLELDARVRDYLPWFQIADEEAAAAMTVRQLLYQTSGFSETDGNRINLDSSLADDALLANMKRLGSVKLLHPPGTSFEYSNINYGLLGAIVEAVSGESFGSYVQQNIFDPLDMKNSYTSMSEADAGGATRGYYPFFGIPVLYDRTMPYSRAVTPWAGVFSSAEDLGHYLIAQLNEGRYGDHALLSPEGVRQLHQPGIEVDRWSGYAMGWWVHPDFDLATREAADSPSRYSIPVAVSHEGSWAAFRTIALMVPEQKVGLVLLMNTNDPAIDSLFGAIGWDVLLIYMGKEPALYPPWEDMIRQHARGIFTAVNLLLLASAVWFVRKLRTWRHSPAVGALRWKAIVGYVLLPLAVDLFLAWFLLAIQLPQAKSTVLVVLRMAPDLGLLVALTLLLTLGWGTLRTLLVLQSIFRRAPGKETAGQEWSLGPAA